VTAYVCVTCGMQHAPSEEPPARCAVCEDERQYVRRGGQEWTTIQELGRSGHRNLREELEPGLTGIHTDPASPSDSGRSWCERRREGSCGTA